MSEGRTGQDVERDDAEPDDEQLMAVLATGEMYPLARLYTRHGGMVRAAIHRHAPEISVAEAEEVGQDVFLALARSAGRYRKSGRFKAWLFGIAVNKTRSWRRSTWVRRNLLRRHHRDPVGIFAVEEASPVVDMENRDELCHALEKLPEAQRDVLLLHAIDGFTGEEIARILGIRPKTVWTRLHRARKTMVELLGKREATAVLGKEGS